MNSLRRSPSPVELRLLVPVIRSGAMLDTDDTLAPQRDAGAALMRARVLERMFGEVDPKPNIDRFELLEELGRGAMGMIYRARDPKLGRDVALKLVRSEAANEASAKRMLQEARGLASLAHPNVVSVFEVGPAQVGIWIAMEYVPGQTLRSWLATPRSWRERLTMLIAAGRGLAAAHAAGLVHRDFKPDNVMVGEDGRARVLDFGLAEAIEALTRDAWLTTTRTEVSGDESTQGIASRAAAGTPAYMAPEAFTGDGVGPHTDQWAFCVTAYEALSGRRPFVGESFVGLLMGIRERDPAPLGRGVPGSVAAAIERGLAKRPDERWPDMNALLDALEDALDGRRRRLFGAGASLAVSVLAGALAIAREPAAPACAVDSSALVGVWDDERRDALRAGFVGTELGFAERSLGHVEAALDGWANAWVAGQREACEATRVSGIASQTQLDRRTRCLARKRSELGAIVDLLVAADAELVAASSELVARLPRVEDCADPELVEERFPIPAGQAGAVEEAYGRIARIRGLAEIGRLDAAQAELGALEREVGEIDYLPLTLELRAVAGEQAAWRYEYDRAVELALAVARAAEAARIDELVARVRVGVAYQVAALWGQAEREAWLIDDAAAAVARLGRERGPLDIDLLVAQGRFAERQADFDAALGHFSDAATLAREFGDRMRETDARLAIARIHAVLGRNSEARMELDAVAEQTTAWLGPDAPTLASIELDRALLDVQRGAFDEAQAHVDRAQVIYAAVFGPHAPAAARADLAEGQLALTRGDLDDAERAFIRATQPGVRTVLVADAYEALGVVHFYQNQFHISIADYRRALALRREQVGDDHPKLAILYSNMGESLAALHEYQDALAAFASCIAILERKLPPDHPDLAFPYKGRAQVQLALGSPALAVVDLERALALHERHPGEPLERADVEFTLAHALAELGESSRAEALARSAQSRYLELDQPERADEIADWLAIH